MCYALIREAIYCSLSVEKFNRMEQFLEILCALNDLLSCDVPFNIINSIIGKF